jgi:hypothetical protein
LAIPSNFILPTLKMFVGKIKFKPVLINVAKGLDPKTDNI